MGAKPNKPPARRGASTKRGNGLLGSVSNGQAAAGVLLALGGCYWYAASSSSSASAGSKLPAEPPKACVDADSNCPVWAEQGECQINAAYMIERCAKSCGICRAQPAPRAARQATDRTRRGETSAAAGAAA
jgi:hypothetical protein